MPGRLLRIVALLSAVATATMPGVLTVSEGLIEAAAAGSAAAHVEAAGGSESCPVAHDAHCAACSLLRHGYTGPGHAHHGVLGSTCSRGVPASRAAAGPSPQHSPGSPRAPPRA